MNIFLIEDEDGVTVFDAGISDMASPQAAAAARHGGIAGFDVVHLPGHADPVTGDVASALEHAATAPA